METKQTYIILFFLLLSNSLFAQNIEIDSVRKDSSFTKSLDSLARSEEEMSVYTLNEVMVFNRPTMNTWEERRQYYILRRKTIKVYPYAVLASKRILELDSRLQRIEGKSAKKKYIKIVQKYLEDEFGATLKKFTQSEGRILLKLVYRQTGESAFQILKKYKSGWSAFWSNATANMFNLSLKSEYNPFKYRNDLMIESILRDSYDKNILEYEIPFWQALEIENEYFNPLPEVESEENKYKY